MNKIFLVLTYFLLFFQNISTQALNNFSFVKQGSDSGTLKDSMYIYISDYKDTASFWDSQNKLILQILWEEGAIKGENDTLRVGIRSNPILPAATVAKNYSLLNPVLIEPKNLDSISFNPNKIKIRLYADTSLFHLSELDNHISLYLIEDDNIFKDMTPYYFDNENDWMELSRSYFNKNDLYTITAFNILIDDIFYDTYDPEIRGNILVPENKVASFNEGVHWYANSFITITVNGKLICNGTETNPIYLDNLNIQLIGKRDTAFDNNLLTAECNWLSTGTFSVEAGDAEIKNSQFRGFYSGDYARAHLLKNQLHFVNTNKSKLTIIESVFDSTGYFISRNSIVEIIDSEFKHYEYESEHYNSFILLKNNKINADAFLEPIQTVNSFIIYDGNTIIKAGDPNDNGNKVGISVYDDNYALIYNNIISGFRSAVEVGYGNKAVIFNNTFVNNDAGIYVYGTPDTISIYNNIFFDQLVAINLDFSTYAGGTNLTYINNNLWKEKNPSYVNPYIDNRTDHSTVIGNTVSFHTDPLFNDLFTYRLTQNSPAIDNGTAVIPSFKYIFAILDTTIVVSDNIVLTEFIGSAPDIGAKEFDGTVDINSDINFPLEFNLFQNFPNPFNPETTIRYSLAQSEKVTLKIYNILGNEIQTLINEFKPAGAYHLKFNASDLSSGVYFYRILAGKFSDTKKFILIK